MGYALLRLRGSVTRRAHRKSEGIGRKVCLLINVKICILFVARCGWRPVLEARRDTWGIGGGGDCSATRRGKC